DGNNEAAEQPSHRWNDVVEEAFADPHVNEGGGELVGLGNEDVGRGSSGQPPHHDENDGESRQVEGKAQRFHAASSIRIEVCHASARRSMNRIPRLMMSPMKPITIASAKVTAAAPPPWAKAMERPSPGTPITSSAVTATTRAM